MIQYIYIKGARVHNLKNIEVKLPKNKLITITGLSGSGKSSLAFDTIYAEGQRRYVESLSAYARQFLGIMEKPDVDLIEGLSPSIAIDQKSNSSNPRSTVGTMTEIYDYFRLLFARIGKIYCYKCDTLIETQTVQQIVDKLLNISQNYKELKLIILSPIVKYRKGTFENLFRDLISKGFIRVRINGEIKQLDTDLKLNKNKKYNIDVVIDRIILSNIKNIPDQDFLDLKQRVTDSVETALKLSNGELIVHLLEDNKDLFFSENLSCSKCTDVSYTSIEPNLFSFNSPQGACEKCNGLGEIMEIDPSLIINPNLTILEGGIFPWSKNLSSDSWYIKILKAFAKKKNFSLKTKIKDINPSILNEILYGSETVIEIEFNDKNIKGKYKNKFEGVIPNLYRRYQETDSEIVKKEIEKYMVNKICDACLGKRLKKQALSIKIDEKNIAQVADMKIKECFDWVKFLNNQIETNHKNNIIFTNQEIEIAKPILNEIEKRLKFLLDIGLNYITLSRATKTLSGGEAQRIKLSSQIGTGLTGVIYVLDEPSIGLHQRDNDKLIKTLKNLRDLGNTIIVVEHDEDTIKSADWIVELGPGAGYLGGELIYSGELKGLKKIKNSITSDYLFNRKIVGDKYLNNNSKKTTRFIKSTKFIEIYGARANNLKNINVSFPLEKFICVTGVSGSGKSTLVNDILNNYLHNTFYNSKRNVGEHNFIKGIEYIDKVVDVDQTPIGRTPRSNPVTYIGLFQDIRNLFANTREARMRGYSISRFSFNVKGGRCEKCKGDGVTKVEMQFLPDIYVTCDQCKGKRYNRETLEVQYKGKNISEVLGMTVEEAIYFFESSHRISQTLKILQDVGLGYITLGQSATKLSGGEAQRIKLAAELKRKYTGRTLYILDEPTTGLHPADIDKLLNVLHKLVDLGNTVIVVEHNLDVIKTADWIIDLGPESGDNGGEIVAEGTVEDIIKNKRSYTGLYLQKILNKN